MFNEFEKIFKDAKEPISEEPGEDDVDEEKKLQLHNLLKVLGGVFHQKLISNDAERRVFSVAFSDAPDPALMGIFDLGIRFGYFHRSTIGNKDGTGRTPLYVLTRRLAPYFNLDPTSFAGYLFVTSHKIWEAINAPDQFLRKVKESGVDSSFEVRQLLLFE
jgi:hypothetical protein